MADRKTAAEIGVKLVLDSNVGEATKHLADGLRQAGDKGHDAGEEIEHAVERGVVKGEIFVKVLEFAKDGVEEVAKGVFELGAKSVEAYRKSAAQVRELAGTLTMINQGSESFEELHEYAGEIKDDLEAMAIQAGETDDTMVNVFNDIIERGGKGAEAAKELTGQMAYAGRAIPGGAEALSAGFQAIEGGLVRARNPIVQLIAATHTMKGSAKSVAKELMKMPIEKQMEIAEKAIGKMSDKMKEAPMTLSQMETSMGVAFENLFETAGEPITKALSPIVSKVRTMFLDADGSLQRGAAAFGSTIARGLDLAIPLIDAMSAAVARNWNDIEAGIKSFYGEVKGTVDYISEHKTEIAQTFIDVTSALWEVGKFFVGPFVSAIKMAVDLVKGAIGGLAELGDKVGLFGKPGTYHAYKVDSARGDAMKSLRGDVNANLTGGSMSGGMKANVEKKFIDHMVEAGATIDEAQKIFDDSFTKATMDHSRTMDEVSKFRAGAVYGDAQSFAKAWAQADRSNDEGVKEYVASFLASNQFLVKELAEHGPEILGAGFEDLVTKLQGMHSRIAGDLKAKPPAGVNGKIEVNQNFTGGIQIKQDFRDQDPDRIVSIMKEDLARQGSTRIQSAFAPAFSF